jgi:hypothetical protein
MSSRSPLEVTALLGEELKLVGFDPKLVSLGRELEQVLQKPYRLVLAKDNGDGFVDVSSRRGSTRSLLGCFHVEKVTVSDCGMNDCTPAGEVRLYRTGEVEAIVSEEGFKSHAYDIEGLRIT